jgi:hypothetical protein
VKSRLSMATTVNFTAKRARFASGLIPGFLLMLLVLALPIAGQAQVFSYTTYNGTITITGYSGPVGPVTIPDTINNFPVVSIAPGAFNGNSDVTGVTISTNVTSIGDDAFEDCYYMTNATIPPGVATIGDFVFTDTALTTVTIPATVTSLGNGVFDACYSLTAINVNAANAAYSSVSGVLFDHAKATLIQCPAGFSGSIAIPNSVTTISGSAFSGCSGLTGITIPGGVTSIGDFAFNASGITSVTIPTGLTSIGSHVFAFCANLTSVSIPNNIISIGPEAFLYCTGLTNVVVGSGVTNLGSYAFGNCTSLTTAYFNGNAPAADATVFSGDNNLLIFFPARAAGWGQYFETIPTWYPVIEGAGIQANQFGFNITGNSNIVFIVQAATNVVNPNWVSLQTNNLAAGAVSFSDPNSGSFSKRFYRLRAP